MRLVARWTRSIALAAGALWAIVLPAAAVARAPFTVRHRAYASTPRFYVSYTGSGRFQTRYHSTPPNPGGAADTNDADDSSSQAWSLTFSQALVVPSCARARRACLDVGALNGARGHAEVSGRVWHRHVDGLFSDQNASISCHVHYATPKNASLTVRLQVRYLRTRRAIAITALNPVGNALADLPAQCPGQGDSIDGLFDNYYGPAFSFSPRYGPDRWFTSAPITVPLRVLHRASLVSIRLRQTAAGTPPRNCAVPSPSYQHCTAAGGWSGLLRLRRTP